MRNIWGRVMCLFLLCVAFAAIPAYAAGAIDTEKNVNLTVSYQNNGAAIARARFDIYRVADVDAYAQMTLTERFAKYPIRLDGQDQSGWNALATTLKGYIWSDSLTPDFCGKTDANGNMTTALKPGLYLVVGFRRSIGDYTYSAAPYLIFLPGSDQEQNTWDYDVTSYPKSASEKNHYDAPDDQLISRRVLKIWDDAGKESSRPKKVTVHLLCDGKVFDTVTLSADNNWRYVWDDLEQDHDWLVTEDAVSGYTQAVTQERITFTVKNTSETTAAEPAKPVDPKLPQTGLLWWPVLVLFAGGLVLVVVGLIRRKGDHRA